MILPDLSRREPSLRELMDDPGCDPTALDRTYARFRQVNALVSGWRHIYRTQLRPVLASARAQGTVQVDGVGQAEGSEQGEGSGQADGTAQAKGRTVTVLDIGTGGADVPLALARWCARDGIAVAVTGIDPDDRAHAFAQRRGLPVSVTMRRASAGDLVAAGESFDVVISNHLLHHVEDAALPVLLEDSTRLARHLVVHNDLVRSRAAYALWAVGSAPIAPGTFVRRDGLTSIRRSYTPTELKAVAPPGWRVLPGRSWHQLLVRRMSGV